MIGHCVAGAGSIELVACALQLDKGFVHKNLNLSDIHPEILKNLEPSKFPVETLEKKINTIIKANFGFGDLNCCVVLRKYQ